MRNLKKLLALVLALVMTMSLMGAASAATEYSDQDDIDAKYGTAVQVLTDMGIFEGTDSANPTFNPTGEITRAEVSALVYRMISTDVEDAQKGLYNFASFDDVPADQWYTGYVTYAANGRFVVGDGNGNFFPYTKVSGVQVLAIMLRALGYGVNKEYEGNGWEIRVMTKAKELGLTGSVNEGILNQPAQRQVVAQLLWNTMWEDVVIYEPARGYVNSNGENPALANLTGAKLFGQKQFDLKNAGQFDLDVWGTPATKYTFNVKSGSSLFEITPEYETTERVDECDVIDTVYPDPATAATLNIEKCFIDGVETGPKAAPVTSDKDGQINPLRTNSYLGAQGRETKIYPVVGGHRIVEKNTYLAQVTRYTKPTTDKNGHVTDATIDIDIVYAGSSDTDIAFCEKVAATGIKVGETVYAVGSYVLVNARFTDYTGAKTNMEDMEKWLASETVAAVKQSTARVKVVSGSVVIVGVPEMAPVGIQTAHKKGYHEISYNTKATGQITANGKDYNCSDKFFLNHLDNDTKIAAREGTSWTAFKDKYGNVIGLTTAATSLMVIEGIRWVGDGSSVYGGTALAQILTADGSRETIKVSSINGTAPTHVGQGGNIDPFDATLDTSWAANGPYYRHLCSYTANEDGTYAISGHWEGETGNGVFAAADNVNASNIDHDWNGKDKYGVGAAGNAKSGSINKGFSYISLSRVNAAGNGMVYVAVDDDTMFLVANEVYDDGDDAGRAKPGTTYTPYKGKNAVPTMTKTEVCYAMGADGFADVVVVYAYEDTSRIFGAYVPYQTYEGTNQSFRANYGYPFQVFKLGETEATTVWLQSKTIGNKDYSIFKDSIYVLQVDSENRIVNDNNVKLGDITHNLVYGLSPDDTHKDVIGKVDKDVVYNGGESDAFPYGVANGKAWKNGNLSFLLRDKDNAYTMSIDSSTKFVLIARDSQKSGYTDVEYVASLSAADLIDGDQVSVIFDTKNGLPNQTDMVAKYVYVLRDLKDWTPDDQPVVTPTVDNLNVYAKDVDAKTWVYIIADDSDVAKALDGKVYSVSVDGVPVYGLDGDVTIDKDNKYGFDSANTANIYGVTGVDSSTDWYQIASIQLADIGVSTASHNITITIYNIDGDGTNYVSRVLTIAVKA